MSPIIRTRSTPAAPRPGGLSNLRFSLVAVFVVAVGVLLAVTRGGFAGTEAGTGAEAEAAAVASREDSLRLSTAPGSTVDLVEFLDFECEACRAAYPAVEQLRAEYGDRVDVVLRYFPVPSHVNAERAARAVEAAARQGRHEAMYALMFETQTEWGEQQVPMDDRFRGYAERIGLDMGRYDADYTDPATAERVEADRRDGLALGVRGTPTFFVNGRMLEPRSLDDLRTALDEALAG
ncbi:Periplasmic thiol:disulfide interchange protein DsbA [Pseudonocardia sp. Ae168_Ps1]|uniref:DsbA family protein n=1 Tax=unclassified Pseudonocardia TaxID=2619320 RepID=UPI00095C4907|nr:MULTISPECIES: thioredoxin domain-containing protein [unclassified Pseudonocardia]OLL74828.1 Periplasmic thiol:disulfide interchange protein DsbA [Pseudonocardia sp. Ae150A_Ps1]OLL80820.1 Periplasmic thiol:disulfide interchange protein DsbA [Pseudonocardia sp. Ae168_Ps1]OLL85062.1 Periplasmic thiol:disulfide interchange protein DsbA [Pseudonocardia sp. Ae263_Ps1]OLL94921.1 Periplasmic thiol:disulfide interchange protein DsbA [Pseudonocardia sp. Ae356_Ps1]